MGSILWLMAIAICSCSLLAQELVGISASVVYDSGDRAFILLIKNGLNSRVAIADDILKRDVRIVYDGNNYYHRQYLKMLDGGGTDRRRVIYISSQGQNESKFHLADFIPSTSAPAESDETSNFINHYRPGEVVLVVFSVMSALGPVEVFCRTSFG